MAYTDDEMKRIIIDQLSWDYRIGMSAYACSSHGKYECQVEQ